jgi:4-amino-4-deoxy-L-arabinose transferase-like glycosyltransferase
MGLPVRQRRVLERIECALRGSDPKLAALYAVFARLTRDEEMPRREQLRHRVLLMLAQVRLALAGIGSRLHIRLLPRQRIVLFFPLAVALAVASIVFAARSSSGSCNPVKSVSASKTVAQTKLCRAPVMPGLTFGR